MGNLSGQMQSKVKRSEIKFLIHDTVLHSIERFLFSLLAKTSRFREEKGGDDDDDDEDERSMIKVKRQISSGVLNLMYVAETDDHKQSLRSGQVRSGQVFSFQEN